MSEGDSPRGTRSVRNLERTDVPELVRLCREHAQYERAPWSEYERVAKLESLLLGADDARCWVADGAGELAAFASVTLERSTWGAGHYLHLDCIYLRPAYRGQGLGRELMAEVARAAVEMGALDLQWQTPSWNDGAVRFYRRLGATSAEKLRFTLSPEQCRAVAREGEAPGDG